MTRAIAIIPARSGSVRIPHKNVLTFRGAPMITWTIRAALQAELFDRVLVSTDSPVIAEIARDAGADVPFFREVFYDAKSPVSDATIASLEQAGRFWKETYTSVVQLMPNCPLRTAADIQDSMEIFTGHGSHFQLSCFRPGWANPWWAATLDEGSRPQPLFPEALSKRSQDLLPTFIPSGAIWIANAQQLIDAGTFWGPGHVWSALPWQSATDIDEPEDLNFAEAVALSMGL